MKEICIDIVDWWNDDFENNYFINFLSQHYRVKRSKNPDYLLCSCFGTNHIQYDCVKIFYTGENLTPDFNFYDYAIGFDILDFGDRYLRFPLFLLYGDTLSKIKQTRSCCSQGDLDNKGFCSFVVSNGKYANPIRESFFHEMQKIDFVASGGGFLNNIGYRVKDKNEFLSKYKFNIAFENSQYPGYCTEKLFEAFASGTIPIYWGDPTLLREDNENYVNPKSCVNINAFDNFKEVLEYIKALHCDNKLYLNVLREPIFLRDDIESFYEKKLFNFFRKIFDSPPPHANSISKQTRKIAMSNARMFYYKKYKRLHMIEKGLDLIRGIKSRIFN